MFELGFSGEGFNGELINVDDKEREGGFDVGGEGCSGNGCRESCCRASTAEDRLGTGGGGRAEMEALGEGGDVGAGVAVGVAVLDGSGGTSKGLVFTDDDGNIA